MMSHAQNVAAPDDNSAIMAAPYAGVTVERNWRGPIVFTACGPAASLMAR
jgi:hypothetical protein